MAEKNRLAGGFALPKPPARAQVTESTARRFVEAEAKKAKESSASRLRREVGGERLAIYLPPELAEQLRVRCARERRSISDAMTEAVAAWMKT